MIEPNRIPLNARLEALIDHYGINKFLSALIGVCWDKAAKATEEGQNPTRWSEIAVKLGIVIEVRKP